MRKDCEHTCPTSFSMSTFDGDEEDRDSIDTLTIEAHLNAQEEEDQRGSQHSDQKGPHHHHVQGHEKVCQKMVCVLVFHFVLFEVTSYNKSTHRFICLF